MNFLGYFSGGLSGAAILIAGMERKGKDGAEGRLLPGSSLFVS